ncbi:hypothetical protein R1flu_008958 [Riccia fluitans]|uniref:Uncharacterized protein n=1 Tax=Riccia fluitans TaxID=41844 RepID=A0ABD1Z171_9MARC
MEATGFEFVPSLYLTPPSSSESDDSNRAEKCRHWWLRLEDVLRAPMLKGKVPRTYSLFSRGMVRETYDSGEILLKQFVRLLCDGYPRQVGRLLAKDNKLIRRFFAGNAKRISGWFQNFAGAGETDHRLGARALARYAFLHREDYWHELEWNGKHSQAPATVASKPHYFSELDVLKTVDNFLEHVPSFWYSEELRDSLDEGEFLGLDPDFFHRELLERLTIDNSDELWLLFEDYLRSESFSTLCQRTLYLMSDRSLLAFLSDLGAALKKLRKNVSSGKELETQEHPKSLKDIPWLEVTFSIGVEWNTLSDAAFCNACASHGREILRLLQDDEHEEEAKTLRILLSEGLQCESAHRRLMQECLQAEKWEVVKWLSMEAWLLFYLTCQDSTSAGSLERLMTEVGIDFLRSEGTSPMPSRGRKRNEKGKSRRTRRRAKKSAHHEDEESESDSDVAHGADDSWRALSWRLSLDKYTIAWTKVDVAEHLVNYALRQWIHWVADETSFEASTHFTVIIVHVKATGSDFRLMTGLYVDKLEVMPRRSQRQMRIFVMPSLMKIMKRSYRSSAAWYIQDSRLGRWGNMGWLDRYVNQTIRI